MAAMFVASWWWPMAVDHGRWVRLCVGMLLVEFFVIHSGGALVSMADLADGAERRKMLLRLAAIYAAIGAVVVVGFHSWEILCSFVAVLSGRFMAAWRARNEADKAAFRRRTAVITVLFVGLLLLSAVAHVPPGGLTPRVLGAVWPNPGRGTWQQHPEKALAVGAAYFLVLGLLELRKPGPPAPGLPPRLS
jgi:hypothetical protein